MLPKFGPILFIVGVLTLLAASMTACGPYNATVAIATATQRCAEAERRAIPSGDDKAAYHYWRAKSYLEKAREENGYAEFQHANEFAVEADKEARKAIDVQEEGKRTKDIRQQKAAQPKPAAEPAPSRSQPPKATTPKAAPKPAPKAAPGKKAPAKPAPKTAPPAKSPTPPAEPADGGT